ncbi:MAG: hypothetical protein F4X59_18175 [Holophagales bacterium]|nr:hypothetical protein [Holophagales bacterium]MYC12032.1 hypothetical protein [Holophagales bacterium]
MKLDLGYEILAWADGGGAEGDRPSTLNEVDDGVLHAKVARATGHVERLVGRILKALNEAMLDNTPLGACLEPGRRGMAHLCEVPQVGHHLVAGFPFQRSYPLQVEIGRMLAQRASNCRSLIGSPLERPLVAAGQFLQEEGLEVVSGGPKRAAN